MIGTTERARGTDRREGERARAASEAARAFLALRGVSVRLGDRIVLDELALEIRRAEIFGLLGPNGSGKSTFFRVLTGLLVPDRGTFEIEGIEASPGSRPFRRLAGVVFQEGALDRRLTARENLRLAALLRGVPRRAAAGRMERLLDDARLGDRADEPVGNLSGGMRRRVEIARALVHEPEILVLDEPTTGLDEGSYRAVWEHLEALRRDRSLTILLTTHRADEAERCDRLAILDSGRVVACDTPEKLRETVRGDLVVLEAEDLEAAASVVRERLGLEPRILDGKVVLEIERAHEWVPRIVEALPRGALRSVGLRRVGMAEVFLELTGQDLDRDQVGAPAGRERR